MSKSNFSNLIEENNVSELSSLVFNQKLTPKSTSTYTDVLDEAEENAVIKQLIGNNCQEEWRTFVLEYFKHFSPFNSSVDILINSAAEQAVAREFLELVIAKSSLREDQAEKLCRLVSSEPVCFHLLEAYCRNPRTMHICSHLHLSLLTIDEKYANAPDIQVKLADLYQACVKKNTFSVV